MLSRTQIDILLIDSNKFDFFAAKDFFDNKKNNFNLIHAKTIEMANSLLSHTISIIITDFYLDDGTIFDFLENKKIEIPIILLTGIENNEIGLKALKGGISDYIIKDVKERYYLEILIVKIESILSKKDEDSTFLEQQTLLKNYQHIIDNYENIDITDLNGSIIFISDNYLKLLGYTMDEVIGNNHSIMNSNYHSKSFFNELWQTIEKKQIWKGVIRNKSKDGTFIWVKTMIIPFLDHNGDIYQYQSVRWDITKEYELNDMINLLNKEIEEHTIKENNLLVEIDKLKKSRSLEPIEELLVLAHSLKDEITQQLNPMDFLELLKKQRQSNINLLIDTLSGTKLRISNILNDVISIINNEKLHYPFEFISIKKLIDNTLYLIKLDANIEYKKLFIKPFSDFYVNINENSILQVLIQLLNFSFRMVHEDKNGKINLTVDFNHSYYRIELFSTGILESLNESILKNKSKFYENKDFLTFNISRKIIEHHNGILLFSIFENCTTFSIVLPN